VFQRPLKTLVAFCDGFHWQMPCMWAPPKGASADREVLTARWLSLNPDPAVPVSGRVLYGVYCMRSLLNHSAACSLPDEAVKCH
jgi:hypothetical protein